MNNPLEQELIELRALVLIQTADLSCVINQLRAIQEKAGQPVNEFDRLYVHERKQRLHVLLEHLEKSRPELAAKVFDLIEDSSTNLPLGYD